MGVKIHSTALENWQTNFRYWKVGVLSGAAFTICNINLLIISEFQTYSIEMISIV